MISRLLVFTLLAFPAIVQANDWPQFRGPNRDDISTEKGLLKEWPKDGPPLAWTAKGLGGGYSTVSIVGDRIYTLGNKSRNISHVLALSRETGEVIWSSEVGQAGGSLGCTPTVDGDRVYALGQEGDLVCLDAKDGKRVWHRNLIKEYGGVYGGWHYCESPLIDGDQLVITPGGTTATMLALNKKTGKEIWKCPLPLKHHQAGYSSIVIATVGGNRHYVQLLNGGVVGVSPDGRFLWKYENLGPNTANIPTPVVVSDKIFAIAGYGKGAALLQLRAKGKDVEVKELYFSREMSNKHGGVVVVDGRVYGDSDDRGTPFCADLASGKILWRRKRDQGNGQSSVSVTYAEGRLYFHYTNGVVALAEAGPEGYKELGSFRVPKPDRHAWAHPVVAGGKLYLREGDLLYCYDIRESR